MTGEELKEILKENNIQQSDIAEKLGISRQALNSKFNAKDISIGFIKEICKAVNISVYKIIKDEPENEIGEESVSYLQKRRIKKLSNASSMNDTNKQTGIPIYDVPIDASFLERYTDDRKHFEPIGFLNLPKLRNCNFAAVISGNSMYPIMKSGTIAACRIIENLDYFDEGEMYLIATTNGFETVKYVQTGETPDELKLIPHNEKIKPTYIKKSMVIRVCLVEAWINFR